jgi:hypothetical protein
MTQPQTLLIDIRFRPKSWRAEWREATLREKYGKRYRPAGSYLGNVNFQGGPITLADPDEGLRGLCMYLVEGYDLILLCQCPDYHTCHRKVIVELLIERSCVEIIQPELARTETETMVCLSVQTELAQIDRHIKDLPPSVGQLLDACITRRTSMKNQAGSVSQARN